MTQSCYPASVLHILIVTQNIVIALNLEDPDLMNSIDVRMCFHVCTCDYHGVCLS